MESDMFKKLYDNLCYPEKTLKSMKLKRFLSQLSYTENFTEIEIFLKKANKNQSTKIDFNTFELLLAHLYNKKQIDGDNLTEMLNNSPIDPDSVYIKKLSQLVKLKGMHVILDRLYDNFNIAFKVLAKQCGDNNVLNYSPFIHFCKIFKLFPDQVNCRQINRYFELISRKKGFIDLNQFLEVVLLVFLDIFAIDKIDEVEDFINELCVFLIRLDTSGGWSVMCKEGNGVDSRSRFGNGIVALNKN